MNSVDRREADARPPLRVLHIITWLDVGGAQENTLLSVSEIGPGFETGLLTGTSSGAMGSMADMALARGVRPVPLRHLRREVSPHHDFLALLELVRRFRRERPDVVHTHSSKAGILGRLAARRAGVPLVVHTVHGWSFHARQRSISRSLAITAERLAARCCDYLLVQSEADMHKGLAAGIGSPDQYRVIRSGVDLSPFRDAARDRRSARRVLGIDVELPLLGSVMRLSAQKDPLTLVAAFALVRDEFPAAQLAIVGDGPLRHQVEEELRRTRLSDCVHLLGVRQDIAAIMPAFDVFALSSLWEGLPRTVVEAMATQVPVVATDVDGTGEIVVDGETGRLVPPSDPRGLAEAISQLLRPSPQRDRMVAAAAARVDEWSLPSMIRGLRSTYAEAR